MSTVLNHIIDIFKNLSSNIYIPHINIFDIIEIIVIILAIYFVARSLKNTRTWIVAKGLVLLGLFYLVAYFFSFTVITKIFESALLVIGIAMVVIFGPDIRKSLENIGSKKLSKSIKGMIKTEKEESKISDNSINEIVSAVKSMAQAKTGAIIVYENSIPLNEFTDTGISLDSNISKQLIMNIFENNTPLHDGAVIVKNNKITAATCYLPLSENKSINKKLGTRHRAAIGITEITDAFAIIVSEETGKISISQNGIINTNVSEETLRKKLLEFQSTTIIKKEKSIKKMLTNNILLKISSIAIGCIVWLTIININNPIISNTFYAIPITYTNEEAIHEYDKTFTITSNELCIVTLKGHRSDVEKIKEEDIQVIADLSKLSEINTIKLSVVTPNENISASLNEEIISLKIEDYVKKTFQPIINTVGEPNDYCYIHTIVPSSNEFSIKGAASVINTIDRIEFHPDITNIKEDTKITASPIIYDKNGTIVPKGRLSLDSLEMSFDIKTYRTKEVSLKCNINYENNMSQYVENAALSTEKIKIAASDSVLDAISNLEIAFPITINESDLVEDAISKEIKISDFAPDWIYIPSKYENLTIEITFKENVDRSFNFSFNDLNILNNTRAYSLSPYTKEFSLVLTGNRKALFSLSKSDIKPFIDLKNVNKGYRTLNIGIPNIDNVKLKENKTVSLQVK